MNIWCCACGVDVAARLTTGREIYPHRPDLSGKVFWKCDVCLNYVGTHKSDKKHTPLGNIPTKALRTARLHIHAILDPLWKEKGMPRGKIYARISERIGRPYHTAEIRTIEEAREIYKIVRGMR